MTRYALRAAPFIALLLAALLLLPSASLAQTPPAAPTSVTVTRADGTLTATWNAVADATKYHITYSSDNKNSWNAAPCGNNCTEGNNDITVSESVASITISGVDNSKPYIVGVRAGNASDQWSEWTNSDSIAPQVLAAPASVDIERAAGSVTVTWSAVTGATSYNINLSADGGWNWTRAVDGAIGASKTITSNIANGSSYVASVQAVNGYGVGGWTNSGSIAPLTPPGPPASVTAARSGTSINVSWTAPADNGGSAVTGYDVNYSANDGYSWTRVHTGLGTTPTSATISGVSNTGDYIIAVRASNAIGAGEWLNSTPVASTLAAPASVKAYKADVEGSLDFIDVEWTAVAGATGYDINSILTVNNLQYHNSEATNVTGTSYRINYVKYYTPQQWVLAVRARNANGPGPWTESAPAAANPTLSVSSVTATTATLTLSPYNGAWHYKADAAPHNTCQGPVSTKTKDLTGLTTGQTYIYAAYSDSACSEDKKFDAADAFTTSGIVLTPATGVSVPEDGTATYTIKLGAAPTSNVTITIAAATESDDDTDITVQDTDDNTAGNQTTAITFTSQNWNTARTITLAAASDTDTANGSRDITHSAASTDTNYGGASATLTATEADNTPYLTASSITSTGATLTIGNHTAAWWYKSATTGKTDCTSVAASTASATLSGLTPGASYTFTAYSDSACSTSLASASAFTTPGIVLNPATSISVTEGSTNTYTVKLATQPSANVSVAIAAATDGNNTDSDITVQDTDDNTTGNQTTAIVFSNTNWNTTRTVTIAAAADTDATNGSRDITHTATSTDSGYNGASATLTATESDTTPHLTASSITRNGATLAIGNHTAAWWYKSTTTGKTDCTAVPANTASTNVTGLTAATSYTFTAYSNSACSTSLASATAFYTPGISVTSDVSVREGSTATYNVKLATQPTHDVTVTISAATTGNNTDTHITIKDTDFNTPGNQTGAITFTSSNWSTTRLITLEAADDTDNHHGLRDIIHTAASTDTNYSGATATVVAHEIDSDPGIHLVPHDVTVTEGGSTTYQVTLNTAPTSPVYFTLTATGGDSDITFAPASFTIDDTGFSYLTGQTVTVSAAADTDTTHGTKTITHTTTSSDSNYNGKTVTLTATEADTTNVLSATGITITTATLNITNHPLPWWYERTAPSGDTTCHSVAANTATVSLSSLSAGVTYTYKAYDKTGCSSADETDSVTFTTPTNIVVTPSAGVTVNEGSTNTYTIKLAAAPTQNVSVAIAAATGGSNDTDDNTTGDQTTAITFTSQNWNTARTVTLAAAEDNDTLGGSRSIVHTATSTDPNYSGSTISLLGSERENDYGINLTPTSVTVTEGGSATYTVKLSRNPGLGDVRVDLTATGGDSDLTFSPSRLDFTGTFDWITGKTVTVSAARDFDTTNGTKTITHTVTSSGAYNGKTATLTATESDDTLSLAASSITKNGATLTLTGYTGTNWYYQHDGPSATCSTAQTGGTATVVGLTPGTAYTFQAYSDSSCQTWVSSQASFTTAGLVFTPAAPTVSENGTGTYTVKLATAPTANVTVAIVAATTGNNTDSDITVKDTDDGTSGDQTTNITFSSTTWNTARTVTLAAADDTDKLTGARDIIHSVTSTDANYSGLTARLTATEVENDPAIVVIPAALSVSEGGGATYTVRLSTAPTQSVTVALTDTGDGDITYNKTSLSFTTTTWSTDQTVTVSAASDTDAANGTKTITHTATSTDTNYSNLTATVRVTERDTSPLLTASSVTSSGASLSVTNHNAGWYYQRAHPTGDSTCTSVSAGSSAAVGSLNADTFYAYSAYSDSACSSANLLDTAHFATSDVFVTNMKGAFAPSKGGVPPHPGYSPIGKFSHSGGTSNVNHMQATKFTTGAQSGGKSGVFMLKSVTGRFGGQSGSPSGMRFRLYKAGIGVYPSPAGSVLARLNGSSPNSAGWYTFTCVDGPVSNYINDCSLQPNTTYFVVAVSMDSGFTRWYKLQDTLSDAELTQPSASGWSMGDTRKMHIDFAYHNYWGTGNTSGWLNTNYEPVPLLLIAADEADPTLTASSVTASGATLTIANHDGTAWYYKSTTTGKTDCTAVAANIGAVNVTGLTASTSYTFSAYSDSTCTTANLLATATAFTTPSS